uniref:Uncharacterized protein n=1 Tax=Rhizophora mucronata TaxID=61149 RepID=A0A2P2R045_RHIMU
MQGIPIGKNIQLGPSVFIPQEIKDFVVRMGQPSGRYYGQNDPIWLPSLCHFPGSNSDSVVRGI